MPIKLKASALSQTRWYEYLVRFVLGGAATVVAGMMAEHFGPAVGGLFLAFPAIFCASATLIEKHERERKAKRGLQGGDRGRGAAALDAAGAAWGSLALAAFAAIMWVTATRGAAVSLLAASLVWLLCAAALWLSRRKLRPR